MIIAQERAATQEKNLIKILYFKVKICYNSTVKLRFGKVKRR